MKFYNSGLRSKHLNEKKWQIHFVGIGGIGMSGIAEVLRNLGYSVSGSDIHETETTRRLTSLGIEVNIGHHRDNIKNASVVVVSSAVGKDNDEVIAAHEVQVPVIPRAEMLAELARLKHSVLVAGAHGKTTTTSLISGLLSKGGLDPTVVIGGRVKDLGSNAKVGLGDFFVAEADESDGSFLKLSPTIAVVTNIDREHMEFFGVMTRLKEAFLEFINKVPFYGLAILCTDNPCVQELLPKVHRRYITYGINDDANFRAVNIVYNGLKTVFDVLHDGESLGAFELPLPGLHNVTNGLAAIAVALELEIPLVVIRKSMREFQGIQRRFELKGQADGIYFFDDYGHHPTEIKAALAAAKTVNRLQDGRLVVLFQPHRYSRTKDLLTEFYPVFKCVDKLILMDIYAASERPIDGIGSGLLLKGIRACGCNAIYIQDRSDIVAFIESYLEPGDLFLTLGAGDVWKLGMDVLIRKSMPN